jgi:hypothetical protein
MGTLEILFLICNLPTKRQEKNSVKIVGKNGTKVLFADGINAVVIESRRNVIVASGLLSSLASAQEWNDEYIEITESMTDLAHGALTTLDVSVVAAAGRMYTIPKGAQEEAKRGLEWRKEHDRGGTPVGVNTARTLAKGGQIGIEKVRHIAKYFPRHEIDKKATGYQPGEKGFPSRGRIAWALWGGDTAWRWAQAIVTRENKKAIRADGYVDSTYKEDEFDYATGKEYSADLSSFEEAISNSLTDTEFVARIRMDGSGIDRLYKKDSDLSVSVWDAGHWHSLAGVDNDFASYDAELDEVFSANDVNHVEIDPESALFLSACFQESPNTPVSLFAVNEEEASMFLNAASELDLEFIDRTLTAAGETPTTSKPGDGVYTPDERSENASSQVRDKTGRFTKNGSRVVVGGDSARGAGSIVSINPATSSVRVKPVSYTHLTLPTT